MKNSVAAIADLESILASFKAPIRFAFGYGSGVYSQKGYASKDNVQIDLIFGVTHTEHWHSLNIRQNRHHYSALASLGEWTVSGIQKNFGAHIYYNALVKINGLNVKYGVIAMDQLLKDMNEWETLYVSGRMHKPINVLRTESNVKLALQTNRYNAVRAALLLLPFEFTEEELFLTIAGLSYTGDFRMIYGENPNKIYNIVYDQMEEFQSIYRPIIQDLPAVDYISDSRIVQDDNLKVRGALIQQLPKNLQEKIKYHHRWYLNRMDQFRSVNTEEPQFSQSVVNSPELPLYVKKGIAEIIRGPAIAQGIKGIFTAGILKSSFYVSAKLAKMARSEKK